MTTHKIYANLYLINSLHNKQQRSASQEKIYQIMSKRLMRFLGETKLLQSLNNNDPKNWLSDHSKIIRDNLKENKTHCVSKVSFKIKNGKVDSANAAVTLAEAGDKIVKEENLMAHLQTIYEKEKCNEVHEILVFFGDVDDATTFLKKVERAGILAREQAVIANLPEELRVR